MRIFFLICSTIFFINNVAFANTPTPSYINKTIVNNFISGDMEKSQAKIYNIKPIYLLNGEKAYISNIAFGLTGRNFSNAYILTRPKLNQSAIVFGPSQGTNFKIYNTKNGNDNVSIISFSKSESGQGSVYENKSFVYFNGWMSNVITVAHSENHIDFCNHSDKNIKEDVSLNLQSNSYTKKIYNSKRCFENYSLVSTNTKPIVFIKNDKEAQQSFAIKIVDGFHGEGPLSWNEIRIIPSMTYKKNGEVTAYYFEIDENKSVTPFTYTIQCKSKKYAQTDSSVEGNYEYSNVFEKFSHGDQNDTAIYTYNKYCK